MKREPKITYITKEAKKYKHFNSLDDKIKYFIDTKVVHEDGCWTPNPVFKRRDEDGYFKSEYKEKHFSLHRVSLERFLGRPLRDKYEACHIRSCKRKDCFRPTHLYEGTSSENTIDSIFSKTHYCPNKKGKYVLNKNQVIEIKWLLYFRANNYINISYKYIANLFGLSEASVSDIAKERSWKYVKI